MHVLLAEKWDLYFLTRHGILSRQPRNFPSEILHQTLSSAEEKIAVLDLSYLIENYGFRNVLILLLVAEGKFVKCSSVYIYIYIGCFFLVFDRQAPAQSSASVASYAACRGGLTVRDKWSQW